MCLGQARFNSLSTTILARDAYNPVAQLLEAFPDASIRAYLQSQLGSDFLITPIPESAIQVLPGDATESFYCLEKGYAEELWAKYQFIGRLVISAAQGAQSASKDGTPLRLAIPKDLLQGEWSRPVVNNLQAPFPHLSFADPSLPNPLLSTIFLEKHQLIHVMRVFHFILFRYITWIRDMVALSLAKGLASEANWGAAFGLSQLEFLDRLAPGISSITRRASVREPIASIPDDNLALILHPTASNAAIAGLLRPYQPNDPAYDLDTYCVPSADVLMTEELRTGGITGLLTSLWNEVSHVGGIEKLISFE
ncbi:hypothetical protein VNI00_010302 [Paramarasmius palmivorus]|uniref:Uncharacterized protein n=1 Tax=Paramarasmius palmivorus TaxID=297713 RepID=A0AAW0CGE8_9AGAR